MNISKQEEAMLMDMNKDLSTFTFSNGNQLWADLYGNKIKILAPTGEVQLVINLTPTGLALDINAKEININADEALNLSSKKINLVAAEKINIESNGNLIQQVKKDCLTEVEGTHKLIAQVQKITAILGNVEIKANDDVRINGERVKLNSSD